MVIVMLLHCYIAVTASQLHVGAKIAFKVALAAFCVEQPHGTTPNRALSFLIAAINAVKRDTAEQHVPGNRNRAMHPFGFLMLRVTCFHRCVEEFTVPQQFCCKCMLPLWTIYEDVQVHDGNCGQSCRNTLGDLGRKLFAIARERKVSQFNLILPGTSEGDDWMSLFQSRIPGVLKMFACLMPKSE